MADGGGPPRCVLLVGCGKMGTAMLRGWRAGNAAARFLVVEPEGAPAELASASNVEWHLTPDALRSGEAPEAVVFAVKPQTVDAVLPHYRRWVRPETVFVSIVAGKTLAGLGRHLGPAPLVRAMPNTAAAIGRAITVACATPLVTRRQRQLCDLLFAAIGESAWVEEEGLIDAVTAVSGSGPAYVFLLIETLARAGEAEGLPPELALRLARGTVAGSGELARVSPERPAQLRENVTSPGGTTRAALDVLMADDGLESLIARAVAAAAARSRELAD
jgi:pyrroline-5-carboxylate reductase